MARLNMVERYVTKLSRESPSVRTAAGAIVRATLLLVVGSGILIRILDPKEYGTSGWGCGGRSRPLRRWATGT